jgi:hypothetical protein
VPDPYWDVIDEAWEERASLPVTRRAGPGTATLAAMLLGLAEALEPPRSEHPPEVVFYERSERPQPIEVHLDPDEPSRSVAVIRD